MCLFSLQVRDVNSKYNNDVNVQIPIPVRLWRAPGCHEFLASLGKSLMQLNVIFCLSSVTLLLCHDLKMLCTQLRSLYFWVRIYWEKTSWKWVFHIPVVLIYYGITIKLALFCLGFDLVDVGKDEVTVKAGKQANKRTLSFALQALVAIFGKYFMTLSLLMFIFLSVVDLMDQLEWLVIAK